MLPEFPPVIITVFPTKDDGQTHFFMDTFIKNLTVKIAKAIIPK